MCFRCVVNAGEVPVEGGEVGNEGSKGREFLVFDFILPTERNPYVHLWNPHSKQSNAKQGKTTCDLGALSFPNGPLLMGAGKIVYRSCTYHGLFISRVPCRDRGILPQGECNTRGSRFVLECVA